MVIQYNIISFLLRWSLSKSVYNTRQVRYSLVLQPLQRNILDPPLSYNDRLNLKIIWFYPLSCLLTKTGHRLTLRHSLCFFRNLPPFFHKKFPNNSPLELLNIFSQETRLQDVSKNVILLLVIYREITMANISLAQTQNLSKEVRKNNIPFLAKENVNSVPYAQSSFLLANSTHSCLLLSEKNIIFFVR